METYTDILAGKIAVALGYINDEQLNLARKILSKDDSTTLGTVLLQRKLLDKKQIETVLDKVKEEIENYDARFVKVALSMEILTQENLNKGRQLQKNCPGVPLRTVLVESGIMDKKQAQAAMDGLKNAKTLTCSKCRKQYTQTAYMPTKSYQCPDCGIDLKEQKQYQEDGKLVFLEETKKELPATDELVLSGASKGLDMKLPEEKEDEMCGKRIEDYKILKLLGAGAMGVVYKAEQIKLRRIVALKMLSEKFSDDSFYIKRFMIEARSAAKLNHPHILQVYDADSYQGGFFFSMEYIHGESIADIVERMKKMPVSNALNIIIQITEGLTEMYEHKIVHRDIKPDNIMLTTKGVAKLADLGLAKNTEYSKEESGLIMGTPYYIAPEQVTSPNDVDFRADIYSLGASFYRMITGVVPFMHHDPRVILNRVVNQELPSATSIDAKIPHSISWVLERMLDKDPSKRQSSPMELLEILTATKDQLSGQASAAAVSKVSLHQSHNIKIEVKEPIDTASLVFQEEKQAAPPDPALEEVLAASDPALAIEESLQKTSRRPMIDKNKTAQMSPEAREKLRQKIRESEKAEQPQEANKGLLVTLIVVLVAIIGLAVFWSLPEKKENKQVKRLTEEDIRLQNFKTLEGKVKTVKESLAKAQMQAVQNECEFFQKTYTDTPEGRKAGQFAQELSDEIELLKIKAREKTVDTYYRSLESKINNHLAAKNYVQALAVLKADHSAYPELKERLEEQKQKVQKIAKEEIDDFFNKAKLAKDKLELQPCIEMLKNTIRNRANAQFPENLQKLEAKKLEIEKILGEVKKSLFALDVQENLYNKLAVADFDGANTVLANSTSKAFQTKFTEEFPIANAYLLQLEKQYSEKIPEYEKELEIVRNWVKMVVLLKKYKNNKTKKKLEKILFTFEFSDGKSVKGKIVRINRKTGNITVRDKNGKVHPWEIRKFTWECRERTIKKLIKQNLEKNSPKIRYQMALIAIITGRLDKARQRLEKLQAKLEKAKPDSKAARQMKKFITALKDRLALQILVRMQFLIREEKTDDLGNLLIDYRQAYLKSDAWKYLQNYYARSLYLEGDSAAEIPVKQAFYRMVIEHFQEYMFYLDIKHIGDLNYRDLSEELQEAFSSALKQAFPTKTIALSENAKIEVIEEDREWIVHDMKFKKHYHIVKATFQKNGNKQAQLEVYSTDSSFYCRQASKKFKR